MRLWKFFSWEREGICRARRRVSGPGRRGSVSFAGRSAVLRRGRSGPALLRCALRCSCRAVACGDPRRVVPDVGRWPLVRRRWRHGCGVLFTARPRCLPGPRDRLVRHDSVGFDQGLAVSRRTPRAVRRSREVAACRVSRCPCRRSLRTAWRIRSIRPRRPSIERVAQSVPNAGASPRRLQNAVASPKRHLGVGFHKLWSPRPRRIPTGCPVSRPDRNGSRPTAPGRPKTLSV